MSAVYRYLVTLVFIAVVVQVGFAGYGAFSVANDVDGGTVNEDKFDDVFGLHAGFGYLVILLGLILLIVALIGGVERKRTGALFGLLILQLVLAWGGTENPVTGSFHPINALVIFALTATLTYNAWRSRGEAAPAAVTT